MILNAYGKINLSLDIVGRRADGYHDVSMVMQSVALCDVLTIHKNDTGRILVKSDCKDVPEGEENLAHRACACMATEFGLTCGFDILIEKHIPVAGGMAGGSTDAAAVMKAVNLLCGLNLSCEQLMERGLQLGADVPFCIQQHPVHATGIGEVLTPVTGLPESLWILLVNPNKKISTKIIYDLVDEGLVYKTVNNRDLICALQKGDYQLACRYMKNVMQGVSSQLCPEITDIVRQLSELGALHAMMSGSGPTCFGIFENKPDLETVQGLFGVYDVLLTKPLF